jgi:hypothetical protein
MILSFDYQDFITQKISYLSLHFHNRTNSRIEIIGSQLNDESIRLEKRPCERNFYPKGYYIRLCKSSRRNVRWIPLHGCKRTAIAAMIEKKQAQEVT